ncbi:hypothetical protein U9M48_006198 [Paspalum notatum var. saurae]|uniref:Uncharacterized protein n=1 Tax=Paspalum notatum var. saurae TaxID=547442 RepID=A0AAQ3PSL6_PASNO
MAMVPMADPPLHLFPCLARHTRGSIGAWSRASSAVGGRGGAFDSSVRPCWGPAARAAAGSGAVRVVLPPGAAGRARSNREPTTHADTRSARQGDWERLREKERQLHTATGADTTGPDPGTWAQST